MKSTAVGVIDALPLPEPKKIVAKGPLLNPAGYQLILQFEVGGGQSYYEKLLKRPTWPKGASGVTVGVGYDLGYNSRKVILSDWKDHEHPREIERLADCAGVTGIRAEARVPEVRDIIISWDEAFGVFDQTTVTKFYRLTAQTYPGFLDLNANAQAGLVSLVFNRGSSMTGKKREEMRLIRDKVASQDYHAIAQLIREMKKHWKGTSIEQGMNRRRDAEAEIIEKSPRNTDSEPALRKRYRSDGDCAIASIESEQIILYSEKHSTVIRETSLIS